jgi:hypothetical protein
MLFLLCKSMVGEIVEYDGSTFVVGLALILGSGLWVVGPSQ